MFLVIEHGSNNLKGHLRRYLYEPSSGIFYGKISARIRENIWQMICNEECEAILIYEYPCEQGYIVMTHGKTKRHPVNIDKINLYEMEHEYFSINDIFAKPDKTLIMDHLYETGQIAKLLLIYGRAVGISNIVAKNLECSLNEAIHFVSFLSACHDIGKIHPKWQLLMLGSEDKTIDKYKSNNLIEEDSDFYKGKPLRHEVYGKMLLNRYLIEQFGYRNLTADNIAQIIEFHHQGKDHSSRDKRGYEVENNEVWDKLHSSAFDMLRKAFLFDGKIVFPRCNIDTDGDKLRYTILSIIITADWIASSEDTNFIKRSMCNSDEEYFEKSQIQIVSWFKENDLWHMSFKKESIDYQGLFGLENPSETQKKVKKIVDKDGPDIKELIIEDVCGAGKTEAAFYAAASLLKSHNKGGIYCGLPTGATSAAMYQREKDFLNNLGLLFNKDLSEFTSKSFLYREEDGEKIWTVPSRLKFLKSSAVGTVDQVMSCVQAYRYAAIRWLGITDKVIIIDELHAYDDYMLDIIKSLLDWCLWADIPVIMLSATLPKIHKKYLLNTGYDYSEKYPLITSVYGDEHRIKEESSVCSKSRSVEYEIIKWKENKTNEIIYLALDLFKRYGGTIAIILNTVDEAIGVYETLHNIYSGELFLLHSRNTESIKQKTTEQIIYRFGKIGKAEGKRPENAIVVSTQMIEQSLDVDFDFLITDIAPIDALIQRVGRWHRHDDKGTIREYSMETKVYIVIPDTISDLNLKLNMLIYDTPYVLEKTIEILDKNSFREPEDIRSLIDGVYQREEITPKRLKLQTFAETTLIKEFRYERFSDKYQQTRFSEIEYVTVCLIEEPLWNDTIKRIDTLDGVRKLMLNNMVSIRKDKLKGYEGEKIKKPDTLRNVIFIKLNNGQCKNADFEIIYDYVVGVKFRKLKK